MWWARRLKGRAATEFENRGVVSEPCRSVLWEFKIGDEWIYRMFAREDNGSFSQICEIV